MEPVQLETRGAVSIIRLTRPEKKNALTVAMYETIVKAMADAASDPAIGALVILGSPGVFTAGNDLKDFMVNPPTGEDSAVFRLLSALVDFPKPLLAGVDGPASGVGTTMLFHCDFVVATPTARLHMPFLNLALVPEGGSSYLLPLLVGTQRASELLLLAEPLSGADAERYGIVNRLAEPAELEATTLEYATKLASKPREAMRIAKDLIRAPHRAAVHEAIKREGKLFIERLMSSEAQEAFMSFMTKKA